MLHMAMERINKELEISWPLVINIQTNWRLVYQVATAGLRCFVILLEKNKVANCKFSSNPSPFVSMRSGVK